MKLFANVLFILSLTITPLTYADVWTSTEEWSSEWEDKYSVWVKDVLSENTFTEGRWAGVPTDCADMLYYSRVIFAYDNSLPFIIRNPGRSGAYITNTYKQFDHLPEGEPRIRAFFKLIADATDTRSLIADTYPITISRESIAPGTIWLRPAFADQTEEAKYSGIPSNPRPGHAELVKTVDQYGNVHKIASTVPRSVRRLFISTQLAFYPVNANLGFRKWKSPIDYLMAEIDLKGFNNEQFYLGRHGENNEQVNFKLYQSQLKKMLQVSTDRSESLIDQLRLGENELCSSIKSRADDILRAEKYKLTTAQNRCLNSWEYNQFSTPSRDAKIKNQYLELLEMAKGMSTEESSQYQIFSSTCPSIEVQTNITLMTQDIVESLLAGQISSSPNSSLEARWGLENHAEDISRKSCMEY